MTCRHCAAEIADKAIVCYRCGTPTADLPSPRLQARTGLPPWVWVVVAIVILAGAVFAYYWVSAPAA